MPLGIPVGPKHLLEEYVVTLSFLQHGCVGRKEGYALPRLIPLTSKDEERHCPCPSPTTSEEIRKTEGGPSPHRLATKVARDLSWSERWRTPAFGTLPSLSHYLVPFKELKITTEILVHYKIEIEMRCLWPHHNIRVDFPS